MNRLLHWFRLMIEPSGRNLEVSVKMPRRWQGVAEDGHRSQAMAYDSACAWVAVRGGRVERARADVPNTAMIWLPVEDELALRRARLDGSSTTADEQSIISSRTGTDG